ncbi:MAG TPA: hypothetical protein VHD90_24645 [Phototrophicaceae bacterium]|nr:hypothetical protein [Phototrophicaceae bacterium]
MDRDLELLACTPQPIALQDFNPVCRLPYECEVKHVYQTMNDFIEFLGFINQQLHGRQIERLETMLMPANFSSIVGEFMANRIPKYCLSLVRNQYHNGHPDLIPTGQFAGNAIQYTHEGIEVKASRYLSGWQGHNPEATWLMIFIFDGNRPNDAARGFVPRPFRFLQVLGAQLTVEDWLIAGRSETSRRTNTASVIRSGFEKLNANWIYQAPR